MKLISKNKVRVQKKPKNTHEENREGLKRIRKCVHTPYVDSKYATFKLGIKFPPKGTIFECRELAPVFWANLTRGCQIMVGTRFSEDVDANKIPKVMKITPHKGGPIKYLVVL